MERIYCKHETKYLRMRKRIHCNAIVALDVIPPGHGEKLILTAWKKSARPKFPIIINFHLCSSIKEEYFYLRPPPAERHRHPLGKNGLTISQPHP